MDNDGGMGERKVTEHTLEEIKDMKELKPNSVEGSKEEVVDAILVEEIEQLDKLDGTRPQEYNEDTFNNTPEGMERLLKSWESISPQEKEVDEELYYIFYDDILNGILPNAINPNFKSPEFEELSNEVFADEFFDEMFRIELRRVLDKKINTNTEGFVNNKAESYMNMFKFFNTQNVETYLKERNFNIDDYAKYLARVDHSFEETFYTLLNYLEAKIKYQKDGDDLMILLENEDYLMEMIGNSTLLVGDICKESPEFRDCLNIQLEKSELQRRYSAQLSSESVRRLKFWRDFAKEGYSKEKVMLELSFRKDNRSSLS